MDGWMACVIQLSNEINVTSVYLSKKKIYIYFFLIFEDFMSVFVFCSHEEFILYYKKPQFRIKPVNHRKIYNTNTSAYSC